MVVQHDRMHWRVRAELQIARGLLAWRRHRAPFLPEFVLPSPRLVQVGNNLSGEGGASSAIPKIIWAYWHDGVLPPLIARCVAGWRRLHPDWHIHVLNARTARDFVPDWPDKLAQATVHQLADWLRLSLLHAHGGIWLDASTVLTQPLDWVLQAHAQFKVQALGLYLDRFTSEPDYPVLEIGLLAAPPHTRFFADVLQEFGCWVIERGAQAYVEHLRQLPNYLKLRQRIDVPQYLTTHLAIQRTLQRTGANYRLAMWRSEDTGYLYHVQAGWSRARLKERLFLMRVGKTVSPLIKLRGPDRRKLDAYLDGHVFLPDSLAGLHLQELA